MSYLSTHTLKRYEYALECVVWCSIWKRKALLPYENRKSTYVRCNIFYEF